MTLDNVDRKILTLLQRDATLSVGAIGELVSISKSACWRRIQRMEEEGVIQQKITIINPEKLGLKLIVFISVRTNQHNKKWAAEFKNTVSLIPEITEVFRMGGEVDYLIKAIVEDISGYDRLYQKLISVELFEVTAGFVMEKIKETKELPILSTDLFIKPKRV